MARKVLPLILIMAGEVLMLTTFKVYFGILLSPLIHFIFSLASGIYLMNLGRNTNEASFAELKTSNTFSRLSTAITAILLIVFIIQAGQLFLEKPINYKDVKSVGSDVIPQVMYITKRFTGGHYPYVPIPIPELGYILTPTYLPFQWLPYVPAEIAGFDYRYTGIVLLSLGVLIYALYIAKLKLPKITLVLLHLLPLIFLFLYKKEQPDLLQVTVESLVTAFYIFTGFALLKKNIYLLAFCLVTCLLSRYSIVLWLPLFVLIFYTNNGLKKTALLLLLITAGVALFYGPFLLRDPLIFKKGYEYYTSASKGEWGIQYWQAQKEYPYHHQGGLGFAIYFYKYIQGDVDAKIQAIKQTHLIVCLGVTVLMGLFYLKVRNTIAPSVYTIASLKIYLTFFYAFIIIPYPYLYLLPAMFNLVVLYAGVRTAIATKK